MDLASVYSCGQRILNLPDLGNSRKQPKPIWKSLHREYSTDTANTSRISCFLIEKTKVPACFPNYRVS